VLVNNAAIADAFMPVEAQSAEYLMNILNSNLTAAFVCSREALKRMPKGSGVVLNLGSINTFRAFAPRHAYGASKAGLEMLSRCQAAELGPQGVRVVTLAPGYIRTAGTAELEAQGKIDAAKIRRRIPMGDFGQPRDIADAALFLASPSASYVNGATLYVDGGWAAFGDAGDAATLADSEVAQ
jgi:NAD(P)-dependent dehydrogenase (short-subunit alcohol dehydrogenase family)